MIVGQSEEGVKLWKRLGASQILGKIHTSATHGREPIVLTYVMATRLLQLGLKFRIHPRVFRKQAHRLRRLSRWDKGVHRSGEHAVRL
jgi:hypothetical protein